MTFIDRLSSYFRPADGSLTETTLRVVSAAYVFITLPFYYSFWGQWHVLGYITGYNLLLGLAGMLSIKRHPEWSRFILVFVTPVLTWLLACLMYPQEVALRMGLVGFRLLLIINVVTPFLVYRLDQARKLGGAVALNLLLIATIDQAAANFPYKFEGIVVNSQLSRIITSIEAVLFVSVVLWTNKRTTQGKEREIKQLLDALTDNAAVLGQMNEQLRQDQQRLEEMNDSKNKLFSVIAHDLRTPINSFEGFSHLLAEHADDLTQAEIREMTLSMRRSFEQVKSLLESLLAWSRSQLNLLEYCPVSGVDAAGSLRRIADMYRPTAEAKGVQLRVDAADAELQCNTDPDLLAGVLRNLVSNAIKYSHKGQCVTLAAYGRAGSIRFSVRDEGMGMDEAQLARLFRIESKRSVPGTANEKGSGLGLILSQEFLALMGAELSVSSKPRQGAEFSFDLPQEVTSLVREEALA